MIWTIHWSNKCLKQLKKLDKDIAKRIIHDVLDIKDDPFAAVCRLANSSFYRLRVGQYRVILDLQQAKMIIFVIESDHRHKIYKK